MNEPHETLVGKTGDPLVNQLNWWIVLCVRALACLMVVVVWVAFFDVILHLGQSFIALAFNVESLIYILGDFLAVLIAIEIFLNIVYYLKQDAVHVPLVLATALTAVSRKVIILDYRNTDSHYIYATAIVIFALGITYWLLTRKSD